MVALGPAGGRAEREADAAADAVLAGRRFVFGPRAPGPGPGRLVVQRYMAWEHLLLGNLDPKAIQATIQGASGNPGAKRPDVGFQHVEAQCRLIDEMGANPGGVDAARLRARYPGLQAVTLSGSGLVTMENGRKERIEAGQFAVHPRNTVHGITNDRDDNLTYIALSIGA